MTGVETPMTGVETVLHDWSGNASVTGVEAEWKWLMRGVEICRRPTLPLQSQKLRLQRLYSGVPGTTLSPPQKQKVPKIFLYQENNV